MWLISIFGSAVSDFAKILLDCDYCPSMPEAGAAPTLVALSMGIAEAVLTCRKIGIFVFMILL